MMLARENYVCTGMSQETYHTGVVLILYRIHGMEHCHLQSLEAVPDTIPLGLSPHPTRLHHLGQVDDIGVEPCRQHCSDHRVLGSKVTVDGLVGEAQRLQKRFKLASQTYGWRIQREREREREREDR